MFVVTRGSVQNIGVEISCCSFQLENDHINDGVMRRRIVDVPPSSEGEKTRTPRRLAKTEAWTSWTCREEDRDVSVRSARTHAHTHTRTHAHGSPPREVKVHTGSLLF